MKILLVERLKDPNIKEGFNKQDRLTEQKKVLVKLGNLKWNDRKFMQIEK